jgi:hypothetical protein
MLMLAVTLSCVATLIVIDRQKESMRRLMDARARSRREGARGPR